MEINDINDITSPDFSLENMLESVEGLANTIADVDDTNMYFYFGLAILSLMITAFFVYKFYINKGKHVKFDDEETYEECENGICAR